MFIVLSSIYGNDLLYISQEIKVPRPRKLQLDTVQWGIPVHALPWGAGVQGLGNFQS